MRKYVPYILSFFIIAATPVTAQIDTVLQKLKKRYEKAYAWGNGYVLEANSVYAFANKQGKLVRPFTMNSFDTVLSDRAIVYNQWRCGGFYIINADGQDVSGCSNNTYRLISKEKRVFGIIMSNNREVLANDSGRQITFNDHAPNLPVNAFLRTQYFNGRDYPLFDRYVINACFPIFPYYYISIHVIFNSVKTFGQIFVRLYLEGVTQRCI